MQFYLSDWFTVSRLPAIIPTFDQIWKLMWLGINFFLWEARLRWQKEIGELSTEEIQEITDNTIPVTTKKP